MKTQSFFRIKFQGDSLTGVLEGGLSFSLVDVSMACLSVIPTYKITFPREIKKNNDNAFYRLMRNHHF